MAIKNDIRAKNGSVAAERIENSEIHTHHHGLTLDEYNKALAECEKAIRAEFTASLHTERANTKEEIERRLRLQVELQVTQGKLANIEASYDETQKLLSEANQSLDALKDQIPSELLKTAKEQLLLTRQLNRLLFSCRIRNFRVVKIFHYPSGFLL